MDDATGARQKRRQARKRHNEEFYQRFLQRRPGARASHEEMVKRLSADPKIVAEMAAAVATARLDYAAPEAPTVQELVLETIVRRERPVLFIQDDWINKAEVTADGEESRELIEALDQARDKLRPLVPLVGRIDVGNFPGNDFLGTGWFVAPDIVVTNRHVAQLVARRDGGRYVFRSGIAGPISSSVCTAHEFDDPAPDRARTFAVKEVLYIEPETGRNDIAFMRVQRRSDGTRQDFIEIASQDAASDLPVVVVGYPARAPKSVIPDQERMQELFRGRYDVKRAAPGLTMPSENLVTRHDCTTLGGNSGSVVLDLKTGKAVGLHYAGLYDESNYAVRASVLADYVNKRRWLAPPLLGIGGSPDETLPPAPVGGGVLQVSGADGATSVTIPITVTVRVGPAGVQDGGAAAGPQAAEAAARDFWDRRPEGVIAARVGFADEGAAIGDAPFIAASAPAEQLAAVRAAGPARFQGFEVRYFAADTAELIDSRPGLEVAESIAYDDEARTGPAFSLAAVDEEMTVLAHVGPEYSWDTLQQFLRGAKNSMVSAIYEFHGDHIAAALRDRLEAGVALELVMDNSTFAKAKPAEGGFDRVKGFKEWAQKFGARFKRVVVPEGASGLIANAYHIKVTVREDDSFWLSSGNWKKDSSQPVITQAQRDAAATKDLPGNREWHVVVANKTLAARYRSHIQQDFKRSKDLGGGEVPKSREAPEFIVEVPVELAQERPAPGRVLAPQKFSGQRRVKPLLTPDREGAVYSKAVLELIHSAQHSLLFQIPYIAMPSNPRADRGFIDELIKALTQKLKTLGDARVLLRSGGSGYSSPTHAAWYFKSKGVKIQSRLRQIENHHTKGMIADGRRVLIGSHNWSGPGVTLNRDASLLFDDPEIAGYFGQAFEIDWARASAVSARKYAKPEGAVAEAAGEQPQYRQVPLAELLREAD